MIVYWVLGRVMCRRFGAGPDAHCPVAPTPVWYRLVEGGGGDDHAAAAAAVLNAARRVGVAFSMMHWTDLAGTRPLVHRLFTGPLRAPLMRLDAWCGPCGVGLLVC